MAQRKLPNQDDMLGKGENPILARYMKNADDDVVASYNRNKIPTSEEMAKLSQKNFNSIFGIKEPENQAEPVGSGEQVVMLKLTDIIDHPNNPYRVHNHKRLEEMTDSIKENGVIEPIIVSSTYGEMDMRGKYICVAGHTRRLASARAGLEDIPAIIRKMSADEIDIQVADSNIQREDTLPSEKAKAYRMKYDAMKRQGKRADLTSSPVETKLRTDEIIAHETGESRASVQRYIRLSYLLPPLLDYVDFSTYSAEQIQKANGKDEYGNPIRVIALRTGVAISYLSEEQQKHVFTCMALFNIKQLPLDFAEKLKADVKENPELDMTYFNRVFQAQFGKKPKAEKKPFSFFASSKSMKESNAYFPTTGYETPEKRDEVVKEALMEYFAKRGIEVK